MTTTSIPASAIVSYTPSVVSPGGIGLALTGTLITNSWRVPIGTMAQFTSAPAVADFFGLNSTEAGLAATYFSGYNNSTIKPALVYFAQYNAAAVGAYLQSAPVTVLTVAQLGALQGSLTAVIDGYTWSASSVNLTGATSYSNAAAIIATALFATDPTEASGSACTIAGTVLTVGGTLTGTFAVGQTITGSSVTANSVIISLGSGTGGAGTYNLSESSTVGSPEAITAKATPGTVTFDRVSGSFLISSGITGVASTMAYATGSLAASIFLTLTTGAVLSQGAAAASPGAFMTSITQIAQNWATFMTTFDPDGGSGNSVKQAFGLWTTQQNNRWNYACWDTDASPTVSVPATESLGYIFAQGDYSGITLIYRTASLDDGNNIAAFYCGAAASINFAAPNGRIVFAFKGQSGITPDITNATTANNLLANGYSFYGDYASSTQQFQFFYNGQVTGPFMWADGYLNQVWLNATIQNDFMILLTTVGSVPYTVAGASLMQNAIVSTIQQALTFGMIATGVPLSSEEIAAVNNQAGLNIATTLFAQGYYLQILPAQADVRASRGSPPCTLWYTDPGGVQKINFNSVAIL